jgi:hypothetical protein
MLKAGYLDQRNPLTIGRVLDPPPDDSIAVSRRHLSTARRAVRRGALTFIARRTTRPSTGRLHGMSSIRAA